MKTWFEQLTGFPEENPDQVRSNLVLDAEFLISKVNGMKFKSGRLEIPTLRELKLSCQSPENYSDNLIITEQIGDIKQIHKDPANRGAMFQAASQFNLLEMVNPDVSPESGVGIYEYDLTQGPACAIACGAGTIFRNYFVNVNGETGQSGDRQIDCLDEIGKAFNNERERLWKMKNGYALAGADGLKDISRHLSGLSMEQYESLKEKLRIGVQWNTEVTISLNRQSVSQAYCSALPVAYSHVPSIFWRDFAYLILEATYEATFFAALKNYETNGNNKLFLTLVGGGAFGNEMSWIVGAIQQALHKFKSTPLEVKIVSYGSPKPQVSRLVESFKN